MLILAIAVAVSMPVGHATNNVHTFYPGSSTVGACSGKCEGLTTSAGSDDTTTTQSVVIGSSPAKDANAASNKAATWTSGTTISITTFATTSTADTILVFVASSKTTTPIQSAPSATGFTCDASARKEVAISAGVGLSEWVCHTSAAISSETVTVTLSATPTWAIAQIISVNGAEDPTGTFSPFDQNSGFVYSANRNNGGGTAAPTVTSVTSLNADDFFISASADTGANTQTAGAIGGTTGAIDISTTSTGALAVEHESFTAILSASSCNFGTATSRWIIFCDALQSAPKYYVVEPDVGATTLTATPSTSTPSGYAWVYDTSGLQANAINDIQSGTWQIDQTIGLSSVTGAPAARLWVTVWSCTTHSLGTCTFLFKNWDTGTNVAAQTAATKNTYTTSSQASFVTPVFLSVEYFIVWQYSGNTAAVTVTHTTVSAKSDIITPGWDTKQSLTASLQTSAVLTRLSNIFKSLSGSLQSASSFAEKSSIFKAISASITLTMGNMVANVNSGQLTCNSNPRSCSTTLTATWTIASGFAEKSSLFRALSGSLSQASGFAEKSSLFRALSGSLSQASGFAEKSSLFRSLSSSLSLTASQVKGLARALSGSLSLASGFAEKSSLFRSLSSSLSLTASETKGLAKALTGSLSLPSDFAEKSSLFRSLTGSLSLAASQVKGLAKSLSGSLSLSSSLAEKSSLFRSLSGALTMTSGFAEKSSLFRSLTGSLSLAASQVKGLAKALSGSLSLVSSFAEKSSLFRSLSGSLSLAASQVKGVAKTLTGSLTLASGFAKKDSLFRSLSGSLSLASGFAKKDSLFRSLSGSLTLASSFVEKSVLFRSLAGSLGLTGYGSKGHTFYYGSTSQTGCAVKCEQLVTTTGTADTATSVKVGGSTTCCFEVQPDVGSAATTATPSDITPTGQAWVYPTDLGGITIQSGSWEFDTTITASRTGTANMRFLVWSCPTASEGIPCTLLFDFTGTANIEATTSATKNIDVSPIEGPFPNVHFLVVEVWISPTVSTGVGAATDTVTTVSGASDVITPAWGYSQGLFATMNLASSFAEKSSLFRSLSGSLGLASALFAGRAENLGASLGSSSSFTERSSLFRSLSGSLSLAGSETKGVAKSLTGSLSLASSFAEKSSLFRSLSGSLSLASGFAEKTSLFRSLTGSLSLATSQTKALAEALTGSLSLGSSFGEKSSLFSDGFSECCGF